MTQSEDRKNAGMGSEDRKLNSLLEAFRRPGQNLAHRVVHSGLWTAIQRVAVRGLNFVQLVVLARLLVPEDFGLFGIALLTRQTLDTLLQFEIDSALIQRQEATDQYLDTAWTLKVLKAVLVAGGLLLTAPYVAAFFDAPGAGPLIRVLSAVVLLRGFENIGVVYFRKELEFRKRFALGFSKALANAVVAISLAVLLGSVWALMAGIVAGAAVRLVLSYTLHPYRPRFELDGGKFRDLWNYGKWLFGSSTLIYASTQGDDILLGRWLGAVSLGVYQVAYRISNAVATEVTHVISSVAFPAYSKLQSVTDSLRRGFLSTLALTSLIVVPLAAAIVLFIPEFVRHVIGEQWEAAIGPVRILAVAGLLRAFSACWGPFYRAQARTEKPFWKNAIRLVLSLGPAYPLTMLYGIEGMSLCVVLGIGGSLAYDLLWAGTRGGIEIEVSAVVRELAGPGLATLGAAGIVLGLQVLSGPGLMSFLGLAAAYVAVYGVFILLLEKAGWATGRAKMLALLDRMD